MSSNPKEAIGSMAIGAIIGGGLFATAIGCGFIVAGPITVPLALGAVLAGGAGGVLFQNAKPSIDKTSSNVSSCFEIMFRHIEIPTPTFQIHKSEQVKRILRIFQLES